MAFSLPYNWRRRAGFQADVPRLIRKSRKLPSVRTVVETPTFQKQAEKLWTQEERLEFIDWIATNPLAGVVIPGADGARKFAGAGVVLANQAERE